MVALAATSRLCKSQYHKYLTVSLLRFLQEVAVGDKVAAGEAKETKKRKKSTTTEAAKKTKKSESGETKPRKRTKNEEVKADDV